MRLLLANLLLKYTKCSVRTAGTTICLVWEFSDNTIVWSLHANKKFKLILSKNSKLVYKKYCPLIKKYVNSI